MPEDYSVHDTARDEAAAGTIGDYYPSSNQTLEDAHKDSFTEGANCYDEIQNNGGNYLNKQYNDVQGTKTNYSLSTTDEYPLAVTHEKGYQWRASNPQTPLPPRPPR